MSNDNSTFTIYCGPMFATKSSRLLMELERYKYQHKHVIVFKPKIDDRYSFSEVVTHGGWKIPAICVDDGADLLKHIADSEVNPKVVAVDEAFMIPGIADALIFLYRSGFDVIVSSLDLAANGKPFSEMTKMFPWATRIEKCTAVCTTCGRDARFTYKKGTAPNEATIEIGGAEMYEPRCARCFPLFSTDVVTSGDKR